MANRPYITKFFIPCTNSIDSVLEKIGSIPELADASKRLKDRFIKHDLESLPPVTEDGLLGKCLPLHAEYIVNTSYSLVFSSSKITTTIFISRELDVYVAIEKHGKKTKVKIIGATSRTLGYDMLRKYLVSSKFIDKDVPTFPSRYYEPLDFTKLDILQKYLLDGVTMQISHLLPSSVELDLENVTYEIIDGDNNNCLEVVEYRDVTIIAIFMVNTKADKIYDHIISIGFDELESAFFDPSEVWNEFLENHPILL